MVGVSSKILHRSFCPSDKPAFNGDFDRLTPDGSLWHTCIFPSWKRWKPMPHIFGLRR